MKFTVVVSLLFAFAPCLICLGGAVAVAVAGGGGWGWLLFAGLLLGGRVSIKDGRTK